MQCLSFIDGNRSSYGVLINLGLVDLEPVLGHQYPTLLDIIEIWKQDYKRVRPHSFVGKIPTC